MPARTLILGGARSGKSHFALDLAGRQAGKKIYLATAEAGDAEMAARIARHRRERDAAWQTLEEPLRLVEALRSLQGRVDAVLLDCLTFWLSNVMMRTESAQKISNEIDALIDAVATADFGLIAVSNEVGQGIVPADTLSRQFRDFSGVLHQQCAAVCETVYFMTAGIPQKIKGP